MISRRETILPDASNTWREYYYCVRSKNTFCESYLVRLMKMMVASREMNSNSI